MLIHFIWNNFRKSGICIKKLYRVWFDLMFTWMVFVIFSWSQDSKRLNIPQVFSHCIWRSWLQWMSLCLGLCAPRGNILALIGYVCPALSGAFIYNMSSELTRCRKEETYFPAETLWVFIITHVQCLVLPCSNNIWKLWILIESPGGVFPFAHEIH